VARHYLGRALDEAHGNKTKAAKLVGLPSYQTFTNWMNRYGVKA
jgi:transcriptional regulator with PAS, ATPase and Fis domain